MEIKLIRKISLGSYIVAAILAITALIFMLDGISVAARVAGVAAGISLMLTGACNFAIATQLPERKRKFGIPVSIIIFFLGCGIIVFYLYIYKL